MRLKVYSDLFLQLEVANVPTSILDQLEKYALDDKEAHLLEAIFNSHLNRRLIENVSLESIANLMVAIYSRPVFNNLALEFNGVITRQLLHKTDQRKYFYYLISINRSTDPNRLLGCALRQLSFMNNSQATIIFRDLAKILSINEVDLILTVMSSAFGNGRVSYLIQLFEESSLENQFILLIKSLDGGYDFYIELARNLYDRALYEKLDSSVVNNGDNSLFCKALRNTSLSIIDLERCIYVNDILIKRKDLIPKTVDFLFEKANIENHYRFLLNFANLFSKRKVLQVISKLDDSEMVDIFFKKYANDPEVSHLKAFI